MVFFDFLGKDKTSWVSRTKALGEDLSKLHDVCHRQGATCGRDLLGSFLGTGNIAQ